MVLKQKDINQYSEPKAQRWRVIAEISTNDAHNVALLCLGSSINQVRENYSTAFSEVLSDEIKRKVRRLTIERFEGLPDSGYWVGQGSVPIPKPAKK